MDTQYKPKIKKSNRRWYGGMKEIRIVFSPEAEEVYNYLNKEAVNSKTDRMILKSVNQKIELIKINPHFGDPINKSLIPREYKEKYNVSNLFRVSLSNFWRMLYSFS